MARAFAIIALASLMLLAAPAQRAAACPDEDCDTGYDGPAIYGPQGPEATQDLSTGVYTFNDGSTSDIYDPPSWHEPTFWDSVQRVIDTIERLIEIPDRYDFGPYGGSDSGTRN